MLKTFQYNEHIKSEVGKPEWSFQKEKKFKISSQQYQIYKAEKNQKSLVLAIRNPIIVHSKAGSVA